MSGALSVAMKGSASSGPSADDASHFLYPVPWKPTGMYLVCTGRKRGESVMGRVGGDEVDFTQGVRAMRHGVE